MSALFSLFFSIMSTVATPAIGHGHITTSAPTAPSTPTTVKPTGPIIHPGPGQNQGSIIYTVQRHR